MEKRSPETSIQCIVVFTADSSIGSVLTPLNITQNIPDVHAVRDMEIKNMQDLED